MSDFCNKLTYRYLTEAELPQAKKLWAICFPEDDEEFIDYYFAERTAANCVFGAFDNANLVSMLCRDSRMMFANGELVPVCFVSGVSTDPAYRNRGIVRTLMSKLDSDLICEGFAAALLQPFDFDFYKKLGYEVFSKRRTAVINEKAIEQAYSELKLTGSEQNKSISFTRPDAALINTVYNTYFGQRNGVLQRSIERCEALAHEFMLSGACSLCAGRAYAFWYPEEGELTLHEFAFENARDALLLLERITAKHSEFLVELPCDRSIPGIPCSAEAEPLSMIKVLRDDCNWLRKLQPEPFDVCAY